MIRKTEIFLFLCTLSATMPCTGQPAPIVLLNPSFEDTPWHSKPPRGWYFCGQPGETPPDVHPAGYFEVGQTAAHGNTYVGMVVRDNQTWEALGQRLQKPMIAGQCYRLSLQACRSSQYRSVSRLTGQPSSYTDPIRIRLWAGNANCDHAQLLAASKPVGDSSWTTLSFLLQPHADFQYLIIEAYYPENATHDYRGNILIDNCSPLLPVNCETRELISNPLSPDFQTPANRNELETVIRNCAPDINFGYGTAELTNQYYKNQNGFFVQENLALNQMVYALESSGAAEIIIAVDAPGKFLLEERIRMLNEKLLAMGLSSHLFRIQAARKRDLKQEWDGLNRDGDLMVRIR